MLVNLFCKQKLSLVEKTGNGAAGVDKLNYLFTNGGIVAAQDCGAAGLKEVKILVSVYIVKICALCLGNADGERIVECKVVLNAAGDVILGLGGNLFGFCAVILKIIENLFKLLIGYTVDGL